MIIYNNLEWLQMINEKKHEKNCKKIDNSTTDSSLDARLKPERFGNYSKKIVFTIWPHFQLTTSDFIQIICFFLLTAMRQQLSRSLWKNFVTKLNHFSFTKWTRLLCMMFTTFYMHAFLIFSAWNAECSIYFELKDFEEILFIHHDVVFVQWVCFTADMFSTIERTFFENRRTKCETFDNAVDVFIWPCTWTSFSKWSCRKQHTSFSLFTFSTACCLRTHLAAVISSNYADGVYLDDFLLDEILRRRPHSVKSTVLKESFNRSNFSKKCW